MSSHAGSSRQAEKDYLRRSGSAAWEQSKPFAVPGEINLPEGLHLIRDFGACVTLLDPAPHHRILDLGAGACWAAEWLQRLGLSVVAVDLSLDLLAVGHERLSRSGPARVACGDAEMLPFHASTFDRVLCLNAIHHVPDVPGALAEVVRVLAPDGVAVFSEPGAGHQQKADAQRAHQDFGVREADIDARWFLEACDAAGFASVVLEPFSHVVPGHGLTSAHWGTWSALASRPRPWRALHTLKRGLLELFGARKETELFEEAFSSEVLRVLRSAMQDHPIVVASKKPLDRFLRRSGERQLPNRAKIRVVGCRESVHPGESFDVSVEVVNCGAAPWIADTMRRGHVRIGAQLLDGDQRLINRDHARQSLLHDVSGGESLRTVIVCTAPTEPGHYLLKIDLVEEGISWFETRAASTPALRPMEVTPVRSQHT
jgi:SAM-dependent methyltransferase